MKRGFIAACAAGMFTPIVVRGQGAAPPTTARVTIDAFNTGFLWESMFGSNWRILWGRTFEAPVLDLGVFAQGLTPIKRGGNQTATLHFRAGDGHRYVFRSIEKRATAVKGDNDLHGTIASRLLQDLESAQDPAAPAIADVMQSAAHVLHPSPSLVVLPDDPRLGEFRKEFAGMLGYFEIKPANDTGDVELFGKANKIRESDELLDDLDASLKNRVDTRAWLSVRLLDALMGDFDRGADQWEWARNDSAGVHIYRPIARDRDWAFMRANGLLVKVVRNGYKKLGIFDGNNEQMVRITFMTHEFERSELVALPRTAWDSVVKAVQTSLPPSVVDSAFRADATADRATTVRMARTFTERVAELSEVADKLFRMVNTEADIFAADERELAEIDRAADGSVRVRLTRCDSTGRPMAEGPAFDRTFTPDITQEIRVYMQEGDDRAVVRGTADRSILVRVIGGGGNDVLMDSSHVAHGGTRTVFYDASARNVIDKGQNTAVDTRSYTMPQPGRLAPLDSADAKHAKQPDVLEERRGRFEDQRISATGVIAQRLQAGEPRAWGSVATVGPVARIQRGGGVVIGARYTRTAWGFRDDPFGNRFSASLLYGTAASRFGAELTDEWHPENSHRSFNVHVSAIDFAENRFYGFGNTPPMVNDPYALVDRTDFSVQPMIQWEAARHTSIGFGAIARCSSPRFVAGSPAADQRPLGTSDFGAVGATVIASRTSVDQPAIPHRGYRISLTSAAYPALWDAKEAFGTTTATIAGYVPIGRATIALRASGARAWGAFPLQDATYLGGSTSIRGFHWNRFAGDAASFGNAELRIPVLRVAPFTRGDLGVILLGDVGRVWYKGNSPGGWHTSAGGGLSFSSLGHAVSVVYAHGEVSRVYLYSGFPF